MQSFQHSKVEAFISLWGSQTLPLGTRAMTFTFWNDIARQFIMVKMTQVCCRSSLENLSLLLKQQRNGWRFRRRRSDQWHVRPFNHMQLNALLRYLYFTNKVSGNRRQIVVVRWGERHKARGQIRQLEKEKVCGTGQWCVVSGTFCIRFFSTTSWVKQKSGGFTVRLRLWERVCSYTRKWRGGGEEDRCGVFV